MKPKLITPLAVASAVFVAAGGFVHLREWLETYREVPGATPGAAVVTVGFPVTAVASAVVALGLVLAAFRWPRSVRPLAVATGIWQLVAIGALVLSREDSVFGWMEPGYSAGAEQSLAVEIGAVVCVVALVGLDTLLRRQPGPRREAVSAS